MSYTPWREILGYDADVTMVVEARGHGKTYGLREQCLRDYLNNGSRFAVITRFEEHIPDVARDYFGALTRLNSKGEATSRLFRDRRFAFRRRGYLYQIAEIPRDHWGDVGWKPEKTDWDVIAYFVALSNYQRYKELTYAGVRRVVFDEALIENPSGHRDYLPDEYERLVSLVDSVTRERADTTAHKPNVYLLSNSVGGIANPYFRHFGINKVPPSGFSWHKDKTLLLYIGDDKAYSREKASDTVAGRMSRGTRAAAASNENRFTTRADAGMIAHKPSTAFCKFGVQVAGYRFAVWVDMETGYYYITQRIPRGTDTFALTTADNTVNYILARRTEPTMRSLCELYRLDLIRFQNEAIQQVFEEQFLPLYGIR